MHRILKFGGSILKDGESFINAGKIISSCEEQTLVVCSAMNGITKKLKEAASSDNRTETVKIIDDVLTFYMETAAEVVDSDNLPKVIESMVLLGKQLKQKQFTGSVNISYEMILSAGENLTAYLLNGVLSSMGVSSSIIFPGQIPLLVEPGKRKIDLRQSGYRLNSLLNGER